TETEDYILLTPNVNFYTSNYPGDFFINIRGQTSVRDSEPSVAMVIDGIPVGDQRAFNQQLFDIEQIEILKGPQGQLYGRNASAGAIVISTRAPSEEFEGYAKFGYGNWDSYRAEGSLSGALIPEVLRVRASASFTGSDGPFSNVNTGEDAYRYQEFTGRVRVDWRPTDNLGLDLRLRSTRGNGGAIAFRAKVGQVPGLSPDGTLVGGMPITDNSTNDNIEIPLVSDVAGDYERELDSLSLKADYAFDDGMTLTSYVSYYGTVDTPSAKNFPYSNPGDRSTDFFGWTPVFGDLTQNNYITTDVYSAEARLTSADDARLRWQVGTQYTHTEKEFLTNIALNGAIPADIPDAALLGFNGFLNGERALIGGGSLPPDPRARIGRDGPTPSTNFSQDDQEGENISGFGNIAFDVTEDLELFVAARFDREERNTSAPGPDEFNLFTGTSFNNCVAFTGMTAAGCVDGIDATFRQLQPKIALNYNIGDSASVYASWAKSFKTGGINRLGTRERLVQSRIPIFLGQGQTPEEARASAEANVLTQDVYDKEVSDVWEIGFKAEMLARRLSLSGAVFYTDTENAQQFRFDPIAFLTAIDLVDSVEIRGAEFDVNARIGDYFTVFGGAGIIDQEIKELRADPSLEGNKFSYASEYNVVAGAQAQWPIGHALEGIARVDYSVMGPMWFDVQNTPGTRRDAVRLMDAQLGIVTDKWEVTLWAKNLLDEIYTAEPVVLLPFINIVYLAEPRSYGLEAKVRF
ncbi:MAG: TonB-dependent receptor, partial [Pseudomonadota bacterium]